jgi:hypothetical protein
MAMMMGRMAPASIAVSGESVYVFYMGTLFKLNADTLEIEAEVQLRPQGMPAMPMGAGPGAPPGAAPPQ